MMASHANFRLSRVVVVVAVVAVAYIVNFVCGSCVVVAAFVCLWCYC